MKKKYVLKKWVKPALLTTIVILAIVVILALDGLTPEQEEIANFLDKKCAEIDSIIEDKKKQLEILEDYKKSLIYEFVTGKKEVPNE